ncbi:GIN domain-containing protein [Robiginitalea myxolifaciens]|nr:DUF2807 domain-containing protein [Robiginitalea myxolifaciens]
MSPVALLAQRKPKIKGNRIVASVNESLPAFRYLDLNDDLEVNLERAAAEGYRLEVDENLVDVLRFEVRDSTLKISSFYNITGSKKLDITVYYTELAGVAATDGELISEQPIPGVSLDLEARDEGRLNMRVRADFCRVLLQGNGKADLNLDADTVSVALMDRSDAVIYTVNKGMEIKLNGNSGLTLEGISTEVRTVLDGNVTYKAQKMEADHLDLQAMESATARVRAVNSCSLSLSGGSRTYIYGNPNITVQEFADRAEIHKEPDQ